MLPPSPKPCPRFRETNPHIVPAASPATGHPGEAADEVLGRRDEWKHLVESKRAILLACPGVVNAFDAFEKSAAVARRVRIVVGRGTAANTVLGTSTVT